MACTSDPVAPSTCEATSTPITDATFARVTAVDVVATRNLAAAAASFNGHVGVAGSFYAHSVQAEELALDNRALRIETVEIGGRSYDVVVAR